MAYLVALFSVTAGVLVFMWAYARRLKVLSGPWIVAESSRND